MKETSLIVYPETEFENARCIALSLLLLFLLLIINNFFFNTN